MAPPVRPGHASGLTPEQRSQVAEALHLARFLIGGDKATADPTLVARRRDRIRQLQQSLQACGHPVRRDPLPIGEIPYRCDRRLCDRCCWCAITLRWEARAGGAA
jgi:hypothetical protein